MRKNELIKAFCLILSFVMGYLMCEVMLKLNDNSESGSNEFKDSKLQYSEPSYTPLEQEIPNVIYPTEKNIVL